MVTSRLLGRRYLGIDLERDFLDISRRRRLEIEDIHTFTTYRAKLKDISAMERLGLSTVCEDEAVGYDLPF